MTEVESAVVQAHYHAGPITASLTMEGGRFIPAFAREWRRERAFCAACAQRILPDVKLTTIGITCYHERCAGKARSRPDSPVKPKTIGFVRGVAVPFNEPCYHRQTDGSYRHELVLPSAIDRTRTDCALKIDHETTVPASVALVHGSRDLQFVARLHDSPIGRSVLQMSLRGCSIGFHTTRARWDWTRPTYPSGVAILEAIRLTEITLCRQRTPASFGTSVTVTRW